MVGAKTSRRRLPEERVVLLGSGSGAESIGACAIARVGFFENIARPCSADLALAIAGPRLEAMIGAIKRLCSFGGFFGHSE